MKAEILDKKENPLLRRTEIIADLEYDGATVSRKQLQEELAKKLKVEPELVAIRHIYPAFGDRKAEAVVHVYQSKEDVDKIESKVYLNRTAGTKKGGKKGSGEKAGKEADKEAEE